MEVGGPEGRGDDGVGRKHRSRKVDGKVTVTRGFKTGAGGRERHTGVICGSWRELRDCG